MDNRDAAQAELLIRALSEVRGKMLTQMNWLEEHDSRLDAAALRRDINEAEDHIIGLRRRSLAAAPTAPLPNRQAR